MKKTILAILLIVSSMSISKAQGCKSYMTMTKGTEIEMTNYDKKGEVSGRSVSKVLDVQSTGNGYISKVQATTYNEKGKVLMTSGDMTIKCSNDVLTIDLRNLVPAESMSAFKDMEVGISGNMLEYPASFNVGQMLGDADMLIEPKSGGMSFLKMAIKITNRKVEGKESINTPAGTFDCYKISYDENMKMGIGVNMHAIEWFAPNIGLIKSESYKGDKLMGSTVLTKLTK